MRRLWWLVLLAGCGGASTMDPPPDPSPLDGEYSGSWDSQSLSHFGSVSFKIAGGKITGKATNSVTGQSAAFSGSVMRLLSGDYFNGRWKYNDQSFDRSFTGSLYETPPGWAALCGLDDGQEPAKRVVSQMTMSLSKD